MNKAALIHFKSEDVRLAVRHPDKNVRALATQRICREIRDNALSKGEKDFANCLLYTSPSPRDATLSRMPSSA